MAELSPPVPPIVPGSVLTTFPVESSTDLPPISTTPISIVTPTPTSAFSTPSPTPSSFVSFSSLSDVSTCTTALIVWDASGPLSNLTISVTDHTINSPLPAAQLVPRQSDSGVTHVDQVIASGLNPTSGVFFWGPVDVPAGTYVLIGQADGLDTVSYSPQFTVSTGNDTSCIVSTVPASAASSASKKSHLAGAIAGGVIGALALAAILIGIFLFWRAYRSSRRARRGPNGHATMRNWKGFSTRDSTFHGSLPSYNNNNKSYRGRGQTESTGKIFSANNSSIGHGGGVGDSPIGSVEDVSTLATTQTDVEKPGKFYSRGSFDYIDAIPPLSYNPRRRSSITISTGANSSIPSYPISSPNGNSPTRTRSSSSQHRNSTLAKLEANAPPSHAIDSNNNIPSRSPSYTSRQRQSLDGRALSNPRDTPAHIVTTTGSGTAMMAAEMTPIGRSASGGARRANRKPVPTYDASTLEDGDGGGDHSPVTTTTSPSSYTGPSVLSRSDSTASTRSRKGYPPTPTSIAPVGVGIGVHQMYSNVKANQSGSGNLSVYGTPVKGRSIEDMKLAAATAVVAGGLELPSLNHKSSFGDGRPVHYLIPDMPPPQRD